MKRKAVKWWLLAAVILLVLVVAIAIFGDALAIRVAPKLVLTAALQDLFSQLEQRFSGDPMGVVASVYNPEGTYTMEVQAHTENAIVGTVSYDMTLQADGPGHRLYADGAASTSAGTLDLAMYLDETFLAVSSGELLDGTYYGITYDTFAEDIRKIPLINFLVSDSMISQWEDSLQEIQKDIGRSGSMAIPGGASYVGLEETLLEISKLPCTVEACTIQLAEGAVPGHRLGFSVGEQQLSQWCAALTGEVTDQKGSAQVSIFLWKGDVVKLSLVYGADDTAMDVNLDFGQNPTENPLTLEWTLRSNGQAEQGSVTISTIRTQGQFQGTWRVQRGDEAETSVTYILDSDTGDLTLTSSAVSEPCYLNLTKTEEGFHMETEDLSKLRQVLLQDDRSSDSKISCAMDVSKGAVVLTPEYKNLDAWSLEDFLILLEGIGSVLGIQLAAALT